MLRFRSRANDRKCLYRYNSGVIQLNVERSRLKSGSKMPWAALTAQSIDNEENGQHQSPSLAFAQIKCAPHPTLSMNDSLSGTLNRLRMK